jgi:hypothetical protein
VVSFVGSFLVVFVMIGAVVAYGNKRPAGAPLTWGEAMVGAVFAFFCLFWAYGVVPESWILWSANEHKWRPDQNLTGPHGTLLKGPISFSKGGLADLITVLIYGFMINAQVVLFIFWNKRGKLQADAKRDAAAKRGRRRGPLARKGQLT